MLPTAPLQHVNQSRETQRVSVSTQSLQINVNVLTEGCWRGVTCVCVRTCTHVRAYVRTVNVHVCVYVYVCVHVRVCVPEKAIQESHQRAEIH